MFEEFFIRALIAGCGLALITGPAGCLVLWRRMAYMGETMAHAALCGLAGALALDLSITAGTFVMALTGALVIARFQRQQAIPVDTGLGIVSHGFLASGLVLLALTDGGIIDVTALLFGDILTVLWTDIILIYACGTAVAVIMVRLWGDLLMVSIHDELARAEGVGVDLVRLLFMLMMAVVIAIAIRLAGVLLVVSLMLVPAAAARRLARGVAGMVLWAALLGSVAVVGGLLASFHLDLPSGPSIVVTALVCLLACSLIPRRV